jgi:hypothetical protein
MVSRRDRYLGVAGQEVVDGGSALLGARCKLIRISIVHLAGLNQEWLQCTPVRAMEISYSSGSGRRQEAKF